MRETVERIRVGARGGRKLAHGVEREPRHRQPNDAARRRELSQHDSQRMVSDDLVVAVGRDDERVRAVDAAAEHTQDVEGGIVGPVNVLQHERPAALQRRCRNGPRVAGIEPDVEERPQGRRRREVLARAPQDIADTVRERPDERRLADAGLAAQEDDPPARRTRCLELDEQLPRSSSSVMTGAS